MVKQDISLRKLSEAIGVTHPTLAKYVEGSKPIESEKLMKIALFFNQPFDYFFKNDNKVIQLMFRAEHPKDEVFNLDINFLKNTIASYNDILGETAYGFIPQKYKLNEIKDQKILFDLVAKVAYEQRRIVDIDKIIPDNYYEVIQNLGIHVIAKDLKNDAFFGASSYSLELGSYIIINDSSRISEERKIFSLLHEDAHLRFHSDQYIDPEHEAFYANGKYDFYEKIANKFAGYFLMPRALVEHFIAARKEVDKYEMKRYYK